MSFLSEAKKQLILAAPIALGQVGQNLIGMTDSLFIGRLGATALGASAFAGSVFIIFLVFGMGILAPLAPLFARIEGQKNHSAASDLLKHSVLLTVLISFCLVLILYTLYKFFKIFWTKPRGLTTRTKFLYHHCLVSGALLAFSGLPSIHRWHW